MRHLKLAFLPLLTAPLFGQYQYYFTDTFPNISINSTYWLLRGNLAGGSTGLDVPYGYTSGSVTSKVAVPDGSADYEVKATLHIEDSSWLSDSEYRIYLRQNSSGTSYYRVDTNLSLGVAGSFQGNVGVWKNISGTWTVLGAVSGVPCHEGSTVRVVMRGDTILVYIDDVLYSRTSDSSRTSGMPGVGGYKIPHVSAIAQVQLGPIDNTAPAPLDPQDIGRTPTVNAVHMQWPAGSDDANGVGVSGYVIYRDGGLLDWAKDTSYVDETVDSNQTYTYSIYVEDFHGNRSTAATFQVTTLNGGPPASEEGDGRRTGIRSTGSYWGAGGEQIDTLSGNLNFTLPLLAASARGGTGVSLGLSYNSQVWRKDSGGTWRLGRDVGYGFGWRLQAGSITPVYLDGQVHHYTFVDGTGAAYRLDVNTSGIWSSKESIYLYYDAGAAILHFPDGSFWTMYCQSAGTEQDSGSRYPTTVQDSNGNRAGISYQPGIGSSGQNTSARIIEVEDVRSTSYTGGWGSFEFFYDADTVPHLTGIKARFATGVEWQFQYLKHQTLISPFSPSAPGWTTEFLQSVESVGLDLTHNFEYDSASGELTTATFPYRGSLRWEYRDFAFSDGRTLREVQNRYLKTMPGGSETTYAFARNESDSSLLTHSAGFLNGPSGNGQKAWFFTTTGDAWRIGLQSSFEERPGSGQTSKRKQEYTWTRNSTLNPYVSEVLSTADQGQAYAKQSKTTQVLDAYGNVTQTNLYGYGGLTTPVRTYTSTYLTGSEYASRYIFNRLLSSTLTDDDNHSLTLVTNTYDTGTLTDVTGLTLHDGAYGTSLAYRGNVTQSVANGLTTNHTFDITGTVRQASDGQGHSVAIDTGGPNTSVPTLITPNSQSNLAQTYTYNDFLGVTAATGPNSSTATTAYDDYTRPTSTTSPTGAVTDFTYNNAERTTTATTNGRWTRTTTDGLGRTIKVETGHGSTTVSTVDTEYDSCGCSPLGKVKQVSQPYAPGGTIYWTTYSYDCLGRTVSVAQPDSTGTSTYVYEGNAVTVTSPSGKWKKYSTDALGNLVQVTEPDPSLGSVQTNYTYNLRGQLTGVSMPRGGTTQTRTFNYDLPTGRLSSATNPENGLVAYTYNADGSVATKTDAKQQVESYTYDAYGRTTQITRTANGQEDPCGRVNLYYDYNPFDEYFTENGWGRLTAMQYGATESQSCQPAGKFRELYSYTTAGLLEEADAA